MTVRVIRLWGGPLAMAVLTVIGLLSALLGDGFWDALSAVALGICLLYTSPSPRDGLLSRMPSSA